MKDYKEITIVACVICERAQTTYFKLAQSKKIKKLHPFIKLGDSYPTQLLAYSREGKRVKEDINLCEEHYNELA